MPVPTTSRTLVVMRHAKAEDTAPTDHARPLTERGVADARAAGEWLHAFGVEEVFPIVSSATRAQQTWREVARSVKGEPRVLDGLFNAGADEVLETVRMTDDVVSALMLVGHNPTMERVVLDLAASGGQAFDAMSARGFPSSAIAVLRVEGAWAVVAPGAAEMLGFHAG